MENHFLEYNDILLKIRELEMKMTMINENKYSIPAISYEEKVNGTSPNNDRMLNYISKGDEYEQELKELKLRKNELYRKHMEEINRVPNEVYRSILRLWFLDKFTISMIADIIGKSESHTKKLKSEAISEFIRLIDTK